MMSTLPPSLTSSWAAWVNNALAVGNTAYALNNGVGIQVGQALMYVDDSSALNLTGVKSLNMTIPTGYIVQNVIKDDKTGTEVIVAYNATTKDMLIGCAGSNGIPADKPS